MHVTDRQREVISLIASGLREKEAASKLNISPRTVEKHIQDVYDRLPQIRGKIKLTHYALAQGWIRNLYL